MRPRFCLTPVALVAWALCQAPAAWAQPTAVEPAAAPVQLAPSPMLSESLPPEARGQVPTFVFGKRISGRTDLETVVEGEAELRRGDTVIRADRLEYYQPDDLARARGGVRINRAGNVYEGPYLELKVDAFEGFFNEPRYRFLRNDAYGQADRVDFLDDDQAVIRNATYTTCQREPGDSWLPDWILTADNIRIDNEEEVGVAEGAMLTFFRVPVLPLPYLSFPLSDKRKSGLLPPTIGIDNVSGFEYTQPYYWNIAPNRDATFTPTLMSKRGVDVGGEFRYLERSYRGELRTNLMPGDKLRDRDRWSYHLRHDGILQSGIPQVGALGLNLNLNRVSDDNYWRDFSRRSTDTLTERLLASDGILSWGRGYVSVTARALKWQTLQDPTSPITPPYDRLPQLLGIWSRPDLAGGLEGYVEADHTRFRSVAGLTGQPDAVRTFTLARLSRPWQAPGWFFTPRLQVHGTQYQFDTPLADGRRRADRFVPTASLDAGLVFERSARYFGRNLLQTLEPRAFYVYTPYREQQGLPNYDTAYQDFNFATIYTENAFVGNDRISDNNLLTLGLSSRLLDADTGAEMVRFGVAQRLRFKDQRVTLPGVAPASERLSDVLLGASVNWTPQWSVDSTVQYNPKTSRSVRSVIGARYSPGDYRVVSAAYRLQRGASEQLDIGWQWPLNDLWGGKGSKLDSGRGQQGGGRWYSVGRINYSLRESRAVDTIIGLEYDACCWIGRIVLERIQSGVSTANKRILFQLEFIGFTRLGTNAVGTLRENIPRYQTLRERVDPPSRFSNYD